MNLNLFALAIPFFTLLMLAEYYWSVKKGKRYFHFDEAVANLNVGIAERLSDLYTTGLFYFVFSWIYNNYALFNLPNNPVTWLLLFLLTDLIWYFYHRFGHEVSLLWSTHVVHHQSDDFNFTVAARITIFQAFVRGFFWSFLPFLGFAPEMTTIILIIHGIYPFFTHTQMVGKLGLLEYILVTPSHHRVHHSSNPQYLDKNYGDVLIIWDKLFGTFAKEEEKPVYGLTSPLNSKSFLWQHFHFLLEMIIAFKRAKGLKKKLIVLFGKPDRIDPAIRPFLEKKLLRRNNRNSTLPSLLKRYISIQTLFMLVILFLVLLFEHYQNTFQLTLAATFIILSVINTGAMLEQKKWIFHIIAGGLLPQYIYIPLFPIPGWLYYSWCWNPLPFYSIIR